MKELKIASFVLMFLLGCRDSKDTLKPVVRDITESVYASGVVVSRNQYEAHSTVTGTVKEIFITEGMPIQKGTAILSISNESERWNSENAKLAAENASVKSKAGKLKEAKLMIELAKTKMEQDALLLHRQQSFWAQNIGSKLDLEQREIAAKNSELNYISAKENYAELKRQIELAATQTKNNYNIANKLASDFILRSDMDGQLFGLNVKQGELVSPQIPLAVIGEKNRFAIELQVDEHDITSVRVGMEVMLVLNSHADSTYTARVTKIEPLMNIKTKTFLIEAEFIVQPQILYPNTSLEANILIRTKKNALLIPREYVDNNSQVVLSNGHRKKIRTGVKDFKMIEVLSGIRKNDELIKPN